MTPRYHELLDSLRNAFPQPVSDPVHDAYFVFSILKALDQVDALKSQAPILGSPTVPDYATARRQRVHNAGRSLEEVIPSLVECLNGLVIYGHPRSQVNVVCNPSIASIIGVLLPSTYNPNLSTDARTGRIEEAEVRVAAMAADLVGYDAARAEGVFTFGGTGGMLYGVRVGLEKAMPGYGRSGLREPAVILCSEQSHYCCLTVASWLGIGQDQVVRVQTNSDNSINVPALEQAAHEAIERGCKIAAIVATMGSTDAFAIDDLAAIHALRNRLVEQFSLDYTPHIHADAVIGWAWSVFNDYSYEENPLEFRGRTVRALAAAQHRIQHLKLSDSLGIDFHKTGYTPYTSSLVLFRDGTDFQRIARNRENMPYLYQSGERHPGMYTLETTRSGGGPLAALANLLLFGKEGLRTLLGHVVEMAEVLREGIESHPNLTVLNGENVGPVTLFRAYPDDVDTFTVKQQERSDRAYRERLLAHNQYNRRIFDRVNADAMAGHGVAISMTDGYRHSDYGEPIAALKSYVLSPFSDESRMHSVLTHVLAAREEIEREAVAS